VADRSTDNRAIPELDTERPSSEVGGEGGSPGNVELGLDRGAGTGSEAGETWRPTERDLNEVVRDETGEGRRNPS
jgi:hypothetical protein